jgi:TetR/AcrR family tetracycline transcriptional repressor
MSLPDPRGRRVGLSRDQVLTTALALLDARGLRAFTLRALAAQLDVDPMTIYWHVKGKDEILDGVVGLVLGRIEAGSAGSWHEQAAQMFRAHRELLLRHPAVLDLILSRPIRSTDAWSGTERFLALVEPEVGRDSAARWLRLLASYTNGFLLTERRVTDGTTSVSKGEALVTRPKTAQAMRELTANSDRDFEAGLGILIDAMVAEVKPA